MFKPGQTHTMRPKTAGGDPYGYQYFPGYDFGASFSVRGRWVIDQETEEAIVYLHKPSITARVNRGETITSPAVHGLVQVGPVHEGTKYDRTATIIEWAEPGVNWRKTEQRLDEKAARIQREQIDIR